ncbi:7002_t:CDS:2 [Cetraspora pellucida]|uniref:7002_t:CDS:1 n=1 Tax=Cetraspora pellucida TaxID=1433469 RepID=A0A9N9P688_9GLOM|nr:7002_t:CDS:2 [Cetraspora pellucida]
MKELNDTDFEKLTADNNLDNVFDTDIFSDIEDDLKLFVGYRIQIGGGRRVDAMTQEILKRTYLCHYSGNQRQTGPLVE